MLKRIFQEPRYTVAAVGGLVAIQGFIFTVIDAGLFSVSMMLLGLAVAVGGLHVEAWPVLMRASQSLRGNFEGFKEGFEQFKEKEEQKRVRQAEERELQKRRGRALANQPELSPTFVSAIPTSSSVPVLQSEKESRPSANLFEVHTAAINPKTEYEEPTMARSTKTPQLDGRRAVLALITLAQEPNANDIGAFRVLGTALDYRLDTDASDKFVEGFKRFDLAELIRSAQSASIESLDKIKALGAANSHRLRGQLYENTKSTLADTIAIARAAGQSGHVVGERVRHVEDTGASGKRLTGQHSQRNSGLAIESATGDFAYSITASRRQGVGGMHCLEATLMTSQATPKFNGSREVELALRVLGTPDVLVELCETRGRARLNGGSILAAVGEPFELFFRLAGTTDAGVLLELYHPSADLNVTPFALDEHFSVTAEPRQATPVPVIVNSPIPVPEWLLQFPEGGVRQVFEHLAAHGVVTESEATKMLGGPRELRSFAREFDKLVALCRFGVRIETVAGVKRFVREGTL